MHRERELSATVGVVLASATFAAVGGCLTVPGTLLPVLVDAFRIRLVEAGSMFALQATAYVLSVASAGPVIQRCGMRAVLSIGMLGFAAGFAGFGLVSTWWGGATMMFISGLGFGVVEVALNTLLIALGGARRANLLNLAQFFFAVGAFVGPAAAARAVAGGVSWRTVFGVAGGLAAAVALGWALQPITAAARVDDSPAQAKTTPLRSKLTIVMALMLAAYVGAEMGIGGWLSKYMVEVRGVDLSYAGTAVSLYWMGLAAGRLVLTATSQYCERGAPRAGLDDRRGGRVCLRARHPAAGAGGGGVCADGARILGDLPGRHRAGRQVSSAERCRHHQCRDYRRGARGHYYSLGDVGDRRRLRAGRRDGFLSCSCAD